MGTSFFYRISFNPLSADVEYTSHENTFLYHLRKRNHKWVKSDKGRRSRKAWRVLA